MSVTIRCPNPECGQKYRVKEESLGGRTTCKKCGLSFTLEMWADETGGSNPDVSHEPPAGEHSSFIEDQQAASAEPSPAATDSVPQKIGPYAVRRRLGGGAMGEVWLAWDPALQREVAIKTLRPEVALRSHGLDRFLREARLAARLHHTNAVTVYQAGVEGQTAYIAMEYVEGQSLDKAVSPGKPMDWHDATRAVRDAAAGLAAAHKLGLIHRDVKPSNLMRTLDGVTKVGDFGLARVQAAQTQLTQQGALLGTPAYMAPELWQRKEADASSDVYALACTYYCLLTGEGPFDADSFVALGYQHTYEPLPDPRQHASVLPDAVCRILVKGASKEPESRYQTAAEMLAELEKLLVMPLELLTFRASWSALGGHMSVTPLSEDDARATPPAILEAGKAAKTGGRGRRTPATNVRTQPGSPPWYRRPALLALVGGGVAAAVLLGIVLLIRTSTGTVKIELSDPKAQVGVKVDGQTIDITGLKEPLRLKVGEHDLLVTSGSYQSVRKSFTVRREQEEILRVALKPRAKVVNNPAPTVKAVEEPVPLETPKPRPAVYAVAVDPPQAKVLVTGKGASIEGILEARTITVAEPDGRAKLIVAGSLEQYGPWHEEIVPKPGDSGQLIVHLKPLPAEFEIAVEPADAEVTASGNGILKKAANGHWKLTVGESVAGTEVILFAKRNGFQDLRHSLRPTPGERGSVALQLTPPPPPPFVFRNGLAIYMSLSGRAGLVQIDWQARVVATAKVGRVRSMAFAGDVLVAATDHRVVIAIGPDGLAKTLYEPPIDHWPVAVGEVPESKQVLLHMVRNEVHEIVDTFVLLSSMPKALPHTILEHHDTSSYPHIASSFVITRQGNVLVADNFGRIRSFPLRDGATLSEPIMSAPKGGTLQGDPSSGCWAILCSRARPAELHIYEDFDNFANLRAPPSPQRGGQAAFGPEGSPLVFARNTPENQGVELFLVDIQNRSFRKLGEYTQGAKEELSSLALGPRLPWPARQQEAASTATQVPERGQATGSPLPRAGEGAKTMSPAGTPGPLSPAVAPFDEKQAKQHRAAWATQVGAPAEITNSIGMKLVLIPPGEFMMGSPDSDKDAYATEKPQHRVRITKRFYLGVTEVTQEQYERTIRTNPSHFKGDPQRPVETVSWDDALEFCRRLGQQEGNRYRLPTEAEWEYACRAGSTTKYGFGDDEAALREHAWFWSNSNKTTLPVGQKEANAWGLFDMHGNVWEWCQDSYDGACYSEPPTDDPRGPSGGAGRVLRGGHWHADGWLCRSAFRLDCRPECRGRNVGFRVACQVASNIEPNSPASQSARALPPIALGASARELGVPTFAAAPLDAETARFHQLGWARHLGLPIETTNSIGMTLVLIPAGEFMMGATPEEISAEEKSAENKPVRRGQAPPDLWAAELLSERPRHRVRITKPFYLCATEVTQRQYERVMMRNPSYFKGDPQRPVEMVSWDDALEFCHRLSQREGYGYCLPTEAQWEHACRAGSATKYCFGDDESRLRDYAWYWANSGWGSHPVGENRPNAWGLYDMHGNVQEWCLDWYDGGYYAKSTNDDPIGPSKGSFHVYRGGAWTFKAGDCRSAHRDILTGCLGFRVARRIGPNAAPEPAASQSPGVRPPIAVGASAREPNAP
jgi:formylglycine-generating enzyme required for sulfatase activity/serine/threonine protein kinase